MRAIFYDTRTTIVTKCMEGSADLIKLNKGPHEEFVEGYVDNPSDYLVVNGAAAMKPRLPYTVSGNVISGIPAGTTAVAGLFPATVINDGVLELVTQYPQKVLVSLLNDMYLAVDVEVQT